PVCRQGAGAGVALGGDQGDRQLRARPAGGRLDALRAASGLGQLLRHGRLGCETADAQRRGGFLTMRLVVFGLTVSSSWGNGHATLWRGLIRELGHRGWVTSFYEKDVPYYRDTRDQGWLDGGELV